MRIAFFRGRWQWLALVCAAWVLGCASAHRSPASEPPLAAPQGTEAPGISLEHIDPVTGTLYFKASEGYTVPKPIQVELHDLNPVGTLRPPQKTDLPYFIFSGRPCENCIQDKALYVLKPQPGRPSTFVYPGKIFEPKARSLVFESRAFYGHCLGGHGDVLVVFQKERIDRRNRLAASVLIAEPGPDHLDERLMEAHLPNLNQTLRAVHGKSCHEIEGRNRVMVSRPSMLLPSHKGHPEVDDENTADDDTSTPEKSPDQSADPKSAEPPKVAPQ